MKTNGLITSTGGGAEKMIPRLDNLPKNVQVRGILWEMEDIARRDGAMYTTSILNRKREELKDTYGIKSPIILGSSKGGPPVFNCIAYNPEAWIGGTILVSTKMGIEPVREAFIENVQNSVLLMFGSREPEFLQTAMKALRVELLRAGKDVNLYVADGGNHGFWMWHREAQQRILDFCLWKWNKARPPSWW